MNLGLNYYLFNVQRGNKDQLDQFVKSWMFTMQFFRFWKAEEGTSGNLLESTVHAASVKREEMRSASNQFGRRNWARPSPTSEFFKSFRI